MTGVAVHFDSPSARPPQALLLMTVPPTSPASTWTRSSGSCARRSTMAQLPGDRHRRRSTRWATTCPACSCPRATEVREARGVSWQRIEAATVDPDLDQGLEARHRRPVLAARPPVAERRVRRRGRGQPALHVDPRRARVPLDSVRDRRPADRPADRRSTRRSSRVVEREPVRGGPSGARVAAELGQLLLRGLAAAQIPVKWRNDLRAALPRPPARRRRAGPRGPAPARAARARSASTAWPLAAALAPSAALLDTAGAGGRAARGAQQDRRRRPGLAAARAAAPSASRAAQRAWAPSRMEYRFSVGATTAPGRLELSADGYGGGRLEWYHFDWKSGSRLRRRRSPAPRPQRAELLPAPLRFRGMPASRFWEFENGDVVLRGRRRRPGGPRAVGGGRLRHALRRRLVHDPDPARRPARSPRSRS